MKFGILFLVAITIAACSKVELTSQLATNSITIDGSSGDWENNLVLLEEQNITIGIANDAENLYFCAASADDVLRRQIIFRGLNLWIDGDGGKSEDYGIKYPVGMITMDPESRRELFQGMRKPQQNVPPDFGPLLDRMTMEFIVMGTNVGAKSYGFETDAFVRVRELVADNPRGIELQFRLQDSQLVYEGKIPFSEISRNRANLSSTIGLGIEIPEIDLPRPGAGMRGGRPGGMGPPPGGRPGGGPGGMRPPRGGGINRDFQNVPEPLKFWSKVTLAQPQDENKE